MRQRKEDEILSEEQFADELAKAHQEIAGQGDSSLSSADGLSTESQLNARLESAKKVMQLLANTRPKTSSGSRETLNIGGLNADATPHQIGRETTSQSFSINDLAVGEIPSNIGRFQIKSLLGHGGFGLVFLARDPELDRELAIKVPTFESLLKDDARGRFQQESRLVASLSHPNIVPIFEVGNDGPISYIASEYIEGTDLQKWVNQYGPVDAMLAAETAVVIADAIQHAHSRKIVHRDLKPANILLKMGSPNSLANEDASQSHQFYDPKMIHVTDFGLAKLLADSDHSLTRTGSVIGTPAYSAPEQLQPQGNSSQESADIYSLGAILYFLLTGKAPFQAPTIVEMIQKVQTLSPVPPRSLAENLPNDLSAICLKCLEKSPRDRYPNIHEARADLTRFVQGKTVKARPVPTYQRFWKWCKRNPAVASLTSVTMASMIVGLFASLWYANNAQVAATRWREAEQDARIEAKTARETYGFMVDLFKSANPMAGKNAEGKRRSRNTTVETVLKTAATNIKTRLIDEPEVRVELMSAIGDVCLDLGMYKDAEALLSESLKTKLQDPDSSGADIARSHLRIGRCYRFLSRDSEARMHLEQALAIFEKQSERDLKSHARCLNQLGMLWIDEDKKKALGYFLQSITRAEQIEDNEDNLWQLHANIASLHTKLGDNNSAREHNRQALENAELAMGADHVAVEPLVSNLAFIEKKLHNYAEARRLQERAIGLISAHLGDNHPSMVGALINLVQICQKTNDLPSAAKFGENMVQAAQDGLPNKHPYLSIALETHGTTLGYSQRYDEARQITQQMINNHTGDDSKSSVNRRLRALLLLARIERMDQRYEASRDAIESILADKRIDTLDGTKIETLFEKANLNAQQKKNIPADDGQSILPSKEFQKAMEFAPNTLIKPGRLAFFEATYFSIAGDQRRALVKLEEAITNDYVNRAALNGPDFDSIRELEKFQDLTATER